MFFIVTTGRSGSQTMAQLLSQHPLCRCYHEPHPILIKLATERCHGQLYDEELRSYLFSPQNPYQLFPHRRGLKLYGESDQKASYLIPLLAELGSITKFLWLIRDGRSVVASTFSRGWYGDEDTSKLKRIWVKYRVQGDLCGEISSNDWAGMSPFEKCAWYWSYTNRFIARDLADLKPASWMQIRLEDLGARLNSVLKFLDLPYYPLHVVQANRSQAPIYSYDQWTDAEKAIFDRWCGAEMDRWYPGWRTSGGVQQAVQGQPERSKWMNYLLTVSSHMRWLGGKAVRQVTSKYNHPSSASSSA